MRVLLRGYGEAARVLVDGRFIGNLYRWRLEARDDGWQATANKYRLAEEGTDYEFRFFLGDIELHATGQFFMDVVCDDQVHRDAVVVKGSTRIWNPQTELTQARSA